MDALTLPGRYLGGWNGKGWGRLLWSPVPVVSRYWIVQPEPLVGSEIQESQTGSCLASSGLSTELTERHSCHVALVKAKHEARPASGEVR